MRMWRRSTGPAPRAVRWSRLSLQAKVMVGATSDPLEREADAVADRVMRTPDAGPALLQRCPGGCPGDEERPGSTLQRCPGGHPGDEIVWRAAQPTERRSSAESEDGTRVDAAAERAIDRHRGGGAPLPAALQRFFEPRFGVRFDDVRLHSDPDAGRLAADVSARAFTVGRDIFFGPSEYRPGSPAGRWLLAHELTHTVQQSGGDHLRRQPDDEAPPAADATPPTAAELSDTYQDDPAALGRALYDVVAESSANVGLALEVLDMVGWLSRDDVAYAFVSNHDLGTIAADDQGRTLLGRLRSEMEGGAPMPSEKAEIRRIDEALEATAPGPELVFPSLDPHVPAFPLDYDPMADLDGELTRQLYVLLETAWSWLASDPGTTLRLLASVQDSLASVRPLIDCVAGPGDDAAVTDLDQASVELGHALERLTDQADVGFEAMREPFSWSGLELVDLDPVLAGVERSGSVGSCVAVTLGPFATGIVDSLAEIDPNQRQRFAGNLTNNPFFGPGFTLGAQAGILIEAKEVLFSVLAAVLDPAAALNDLRKAMDQAATLVDELAGPRGADVAQQIGRGVGSQLGATIAELNEANGRFMFAFRLGEEVGPAIVYTVLSLLGFEEFVAGRLLLLAGDALKGLETFAGLASVFRRAPDVPSARGTPEPGRAGRGAKLATVPALDIDLGRLGVHRISLVDRGGRLVVQVCSSPACGELIARIEQAIATAGPNTPTDAYRDLVAEVRRLDQYWDMIGDEAAEAELRKLQQRFADAHARAPELTRAVVEPGTGVGRGVERPGFGIRERLYGDLDVIAEDLFPGRTLDRIVEEEDMGVVSDADIAREFTALNENPGNWRSMHYVVAFEDGTQETISVFRKEVLGQVEFRGPHA